MCDLLFQGSLPPFFSFFPSSLLPIQDLRYQYMIYIPPFVSYRTSSYYHNMIVFHLSPLQSLVKRRSTMFLSTIYFKICTVESPMLPLTRYLLTSVLGLLCGNKTNTQGLIWTLEYGVFYIRTSTYFKTQCKVSQLLRGLGGCRGNHVTYTLFDSHLYISNLSHQVPPTVQLKKLKVLEREGTRGGRKDQ